MKYNSRTGPREARRLAKTGEWIEECQRRFEKWRAKEVQRAWIRMPNFKLCIQKKHRVYRIGQMVHPGGAMILTNRATGEYKAVIHKHRYWLVGAYRFDSWYRDTPQWMLLRDDGRLSAYADILAIEGTLEEHHNNLRRKAVEATNQQRQWMQEREQRQDQRESAQQNYYPPIPTPSPVKEEEWVTPEKGNAVFDSEGNFFFKPSAN